MALQISKQKESLANQLRLAEQLEGIQLKSPQIFGLLIDSLAQLPNGKAFAAIDEKTVVFGLKAIGKNLDDDLKKKPSLSVLETKIMPEFLESLVRSRSVKLATIKSALDLFKLYRGIPKTLE